jgi:hypothetical protein
MFVQFPRKEESVHMNRCVVDGFGVVVCGVGKARAVDARRNTAVRSENIVAMVCRGDDVKAGEMVKLRCCGGRDVAFLTKRVCVTVFLPIY